MKKEGISKSEMAKRMGTSRSQLERLLDPKNPHILLDSLKQDMGILWVKESLELAATSSHPLCHFTLADTLLLHGFSDFPGQYPLPGECRHFFVKPLGLQKLVERGAQMLISPSCHFPPPSAASPPDRAPPPASAESS